MANNSTVSPKAEIYKNEVETIFMSHSSKLSDHHKTSIEKIEKWRKTWNDKIDRHAAENINLLNESYERLLTIVEEKRKLCLEIATTSYDSSNEESLEKLQNACRLLKFQAARIKISKPDSDFLPIKLSEETVEDPQIDQLYKSLKKTARSRRRDRRNTQKILQNTEDPLTSPTSKDQSPVSTQTKDRDSPETQSRVHENQATSIVNDDESQIQCEASQIQCPICFMIFPPNMKNYQRNEHVNDHIVD